jgi:hypothetical protein
MIRIAIAITLLLIVISPLAIFGNTDESQCPCPYYSSDWIILSDTSTSIPDFFFQPYVAVKRMVICEHGIYFFFCAKDKGRHRNTCLAYPKPTEELYYKYFERDSLAEDSAGGGLHSGPQKFLMDYEQFKEHLRDMLGRRYKEKRLLYFDRFHTQKPKLSFANPLAFTWRNQASQFQGLLDVYFK